MASMAVVANAGLLPLRDSLLLVIGWVGSLFVTSAVLWFNLEVGGPC